MKPVMSTSNLMEKKTNPFEYFQRSIKEHESTPDEIDEDTGKFITGDHERQKSNMITK
jgi:hypothetical protein